MVRSGLPMKSVDHLARRLRVPVADVEMIAGIPRSTAHRKRTAKEKLKPASSERVVRIASVFSIAAGVLESDEKAAYWLQQPNRALHGSKPVDLLDTEIGARAVEQVLNRLEHGIYS